MKFIRSPFVVAIMGFISITFAFGQLAAAQGWNYGTRTLTVSSAALNFGAVTLNSISTQALTLQSTGTRSVTIDALSIAGNGFTVSALSLPMRIRAGQSVTIQVSFDPTVAGAAAGNVTITSNSSTGSTTTVSLSGSGAGTTGNPVLTIGATSLNFGSVSLGTPITQSLSLSSTGTAAVTVSAVSVSGAGFAVSGATLPVTLNPGVAIKLQVQFDPTSIGASAGMLTIASNSSTGGSTVVSLSGTGTAVQHQVTLNWNGPASSPVPVSGYNVYRSPSGATTFQLLNSAPDSQTSYVDQAVQSGSSYSYYVKSVDAAGAESSPSNQTTVTIP
jgi:hypothetical protein